MSDQTLSFAQPFAGGTSVGVAIEVPEPLATRLARLRRSIEGEPSQAVIGPHITLVPPTHLPTHDITGVERELERAARSVAPFTVVLDGPGTFRPVSPVVYVALVQGAGECDTLQRRVRQGPLAGDLRFDYHPHVTVAQEVPDPALQAAERALRGFRATFPVDSFVLYEMGPDSCWRSIRSYRLTGRGRATIAAGAKEQR